MPRQVIEHTIRFRGTSTGACLKITSRSTPRRLPVAPSLRRWMWTRDGQELETGRRSFQPSQIGGGGDGSGRNGEGGGGGRGSGDGANMGLGGMEGNAEPPPHPQQRTSGVVSCHA